MWTWKIETISSSAFCLLWWTSVFLLPFIFLTSYMGICLVVVCFISCGLSQITSCLIPLIIFFLSFSFLMTQQPHAEGWFTFMWTTQPIFCSQAPGLEPLYLLAFSLEHLHACIKPCLIHLSWIVYIWKQMHLIRFVQLQLWKTF